MILASLAPRTFAARRNSLVLRERASDLTSLAVAVQPVRPMMMVMKARLEPKMKTMKTRRRKRGKVITTSVKRIRALSTRPPK